ncbi:MAG: cysteine hydrolase family protein [Microcella sp.]|uniref:cysteine hydrolase family protein n=1 Tax=Microcella sp. TaxID=1913979 RepID=UPI003315B6FC
MPSAPAAARPALIVVDVQGGFDDARWGARDNPGCEANILALLQSWRDAGDPVVLVRHDSVSEGSPLRPGQPGNVFKPGIDGAHHVLVTKSVNSAFYGEPDLHAWLQERGITELAICGIQTNKCCETTARMAGNLGYDTTFVLDATHTFDAVDLDGATIPATELARVTAANLHGEFATVRSTAEVLQGRR